MTPKNHDDLPMEDLEFDKLIEQSTAYMEARNERMSRHFGISTYSSWKADLRHRDIWWCAGEVPKVRAKVTVVGSLAKQTETWLWAWANPSFEGVDIGPIAEVREFGEREGLEPLTERKWPYEDEVEGWQMAGLSARLLEADGVFCTQGNIPLFLLLHELEFIPEEEQDRYPAGGRM